MISGAALAIPGIIATISDVIDLAKTFGPPAMDAAKGFVDEIEKGVESVRDTVEGFVKMNAEDTLAALAILKADLATARQAVLDSQGPARADQ